jgi:hypothetical protein
VGAWEAGRSRFVAGDFNGDGRADIGGFYDYGSAHARLFVWDGTTTGFTGPTQRWDSTGPNTWDANRSRFI